MKKLGAELKRHALTAISYMLPLVVASGLLIAIGNLMGGENVTELSKMTLPSALTTLGVMGMGLLPSFIAGYIAYSIADRPGIAVGMATAIPDAPFTNKLGIRVGMTVGSCNVSSKLF